MTNEEAIQKIREALAKEPYGEVYQTASLKLVVARVITLIEKYAEKDIYDSILKAIEGKHE